MKKMHILLMLSLSLFLSNLAAAEHLTPKSILESLKTHQDKIKSLESDFTLKLHGVSDLNIIQTGTYNYKSPNNLILDILTPVKQTLKIKGSKAEISSNGGPFKPVNNNQQTAGMSNDLFYYYFLSNFHLDIDFENKLASNLYKVTGYKKNNDGTIATAKDDRNPKAVEFIYDKNSGLVTQINFIGYQSMPPMEIALIYQSKNWIKVPKEVNAKVITPGGIMKSDMKFENMKVEKH